MQRIIIFSFLVLLACSCSRKENSDFIWEKSYGSGNAYFVSSAPDSGIVACGELNGNPYLIKLSKEKSIISEFTSDRSGLFSSTWYDTSGFIACGSSNGKMLLTRIGKDNYKIWDTIISAGFNVSFTRLCYSGSGNFLAVGTASPDTAGTGATGLLFLRFDKKGHILAKKENTENAYISAGGATIDASGNIYLPLMRKNTVAKSTATVAKYNSDFAKLWETQLYNNPAVSSLCTGIVSDNAGNIYVTGKTGVAGSTGTLNNSFAASLNSSGVIIWKKYLEDSNSGSVMLINDSDILMLLNRNCFIIDLLSNYKSKDVAVDGLIRIFNACDPYNTDAFGSDFDIDQDGNILAAGSMGGKFYLALKSASQ